MRDFFQGITPLRLALAAALMLLLFWVGTYDTVVFAGLTSFWQRTLALVGLGDWAQRLQQGTSGQVTTRSLPAMLSYGLGYTSICLLVLWLLLPARAVRVAAALYGAVFLISAAAILLGKLLGNVVWPYKLGRHLIDFIVSPLPVVALLPLLRWYYTVPPPPATQPLPHH